MSSTSKLIALALVLAAAAAVTFSFMAGGPEMAPLQNEAATKAPANGASAPLSPSSLDANASAEGTNAESPGAALPVVDPATLPTEKTSILESIDDAAVSYDAAELPKIQPFLLHPDPEVRKAALDGMVTLGDSAASPMLRSAAKLALTPEEAAAMNEAAAYLELPSGSMLNMKSKKKN